MAVDISTLKRELNITWEDAETEEQLKALELRAESILCDKAGEELDFSQPSVELQLLFDLIKYLRSNAYNQFLIDYSEELTALRLNHAGVHE